MSTWGVTASANDSHIRFENNNTGEIFMYPNGGMGFGLDASDNLYIQYGGEVVFSQPIMDTDLTGGDAATKLGTLEALVQCT